MRVLSQGSLEEGECVFLDTLHWDAIDDCSGTERTATWMDSRLDCGISRQVGNQQRLTGNLSCTAADDAHVGAVHVHFPVSDRINPGPCERASFAARQILWKIHGPVIALF